MEPRKIERRDKRPTGAPQLHDNAMNRDGNDIEQFVEGDTPPMAVQVANVAFREAKDEGCTCDEPNIALSPTFVPPFWRAVVEHEPDCALLKRLIAHGAPLTIPEHLR